MCIYVSPHSPPACCVLRPAQIVTSTPVSISNPINIKSPAVQGAASVSKGGGLLGAAAGAVGGLAGGLLGGIFKGRQ